ncbi:MAG TPA: S8 family serine peptidase, partial [Polyangiaceae bacterium]|nr:S8 family serine peptidase [Polyangiaceae bacterium]
MTRNRNVHSGSFARSWARPACGVIVAIAATACSGQADDRPAAGDENTTSNASALVTAAQLSATNAPPAGAPGGFSSGPSHVAGMRGAPPASVPGEVIVKLTQVADASELEQQALTAAATGKVVRHARSTRLDATFQKHGVMSARRVFPAAQTAQLSRTFRLWSAKGTTAQLIADLQQLPEVEYAEPNRVHHVVMTPNDTYYASSGAWHQTFRDLWGLQAIAMPSAWDQTTGAGVVVGIIDTGIDYTHSDIAANIWQNSGEVGLDSAGHDKRSNGIDDDNDGYIDDWRGYNFVSTGSPEAKNDPMDDFGHGTHVAGTVAAIGNNQAGVVGVAMGARVMALKGLDQNGSGTDADLANAIHYAADHGCAVINASWGAFSGSRDSTLIDAVNYAHDTKGVVFVAAAGNSTQDVGSEAGTGAGFYPAAARNAITVSAVTQTDALSSFSNSGVKIDVAAPGGGDSDSTGTVVSPERSILSLLSSHANPTMTNNGALVVGTSYLRQAGTSMAAPHVAGVAALVRALRPTLSVEQVRQALRVGSDDLFTPGFDTQAGYGRLNATKALAQSAPLNAHLLGPLAVNGLSSVAITGSASGPAFASYTLEYGAGSTPTSFTNITTSTQAVVSGTLGTWNLTNVVDGTYTLHLKAVTTTGATYEDRLPVVFDNVSISSPDPTRTQSFGTTPITIAGTVAPPTLSSFAVQIVSAKTGQLTNPKVTLSGGGTHPVVNGTIATWDPTGLPADHYTVEVLATLSGGTVIQKNAPVIYDPTLHPGWPLMPPASGLSGFGNLTAVDMNSDGASELVYGLGTAVTVVKADGTPLTGWPQPIDANVPGSIIQYAPAVGDIDGDGKPDVVAGNCEVFNNSCFGEVFAWHANGTPVTGFPVQFAGNGHVALGDIDGDGVLDVVATSYMGTLTVFKGNGSVLPGFPVNLGAELYPASIADVDGDGHNDMVVGDIRGASLWAVGQNGAVKSGFPFALGPSSGSALTNDSLPVLADVDGDGKADILDGSLDGKLHAVNYRGVELPGWPKQGQATPMHSAAIGDINGDGRLEIVSGNEGFFDGAGVLHDYVNAFHTDGSILSGWPFQVSVPAGSAIQYFGFGAPALADVDGDGRPDVVLSSDTLAAAPAALHALRYDGTELPGWPKPTSDNGADPVNTVAVSDIDGDGLSEAAFMTFDGQLLVYDLPSPASTANPWP